MDMNFIDLEIVEAFKRGDRIGLPFEGCTLFPQQFELLHHTDSGDEMTFVLDALEECEQETRSLVTQKLVDKKLALALKSNHGSDESSIVDCFLKFVEGYDYTTDERFVWDWLCYHQQHHGTGYGRTYRAD